MCQPYVYILTNKNTGDFYIGYRSANKVSAINDLGIKYFTSSKHVKNNFSLFEITNLIEFISKEDAYDYEQNLIFESWGNPKLLNKHYNINGKSRFISPSKEPWNKGKKCDSIAKAKKGCIPWNKGKRGSMKGKIVPWSTERRLYMSEIKTGVKRPDHVINAMINARQRKCCCTICKKELSLSGLASHSKMH